MWSNKFSESCRGSHQTMKTKQKQRSSHQIQKFVLKMNKNIEKKCKKQFTIGEIDKNKMVSNLVPLVSQRIEKWAESSLQVLGIILMKMMGHQLMENGYSILKLKILTAIQDIEKSMIFHKYYVLFNFKTSPHELATIFNSSFKLVQNSLKNQQLTQKYLHVLRNSQEYKADCVKIHRIVIDHMRKFEICLQFFTILIKMILMLVHYPKLDSMTQNLSPKQIYFIVCDYLDCQIQKNSQCYIFQKGHFIQETPYHFQFGIIINPSIKPHFKTLLFSAENKSAFKSAQNLFSHELRPKITYGKPSALKNTEHSPQKDSPPQLYLKHTFSFQNIDHQKQIQQCESMFELAGQNSTYIDKENRETSNANASEGSDKLASILNTTASVYKKQNQKPELGQRRSFNVSEIKSRARSEFKCFRCSQKKELSCYSNVLKVRI